LKNIGLSAIDRSK